MRNLRQADLSTILIVILWLAFGAAIVVALFAVVFLDLSFIIDDEPLHISPAVGLLNFALPIGLLVTILHWLTLQNGSITLRKKTGIIGLATFAATIVYLIPLGLLRLFPMHPDSYLAGNFTRLTIVTWLIIAIVGTFTLAASRRQPLTIVWRMVVIGPLIGLALVVVLAYPAYTLTYTSIVPGVTYSGPLHLGKVVVSVILGAILALAIGPLVVGSFNSGQRLHCLAAGSTGGAIAGAILFAGLGGPVAGLIAQEPLYGVALSRTGYGNPNEWLLKLAIAVNSIFPWTYGVFWLLVIGGAVIGGATALLVTARSVPAGEKSVVQTQWPLIFLFPAFPILWIMAIINIAFFLLLGPVLQRVFNLVGYAPRWRTEWLLPTSIAPFWLALTIIQLAGLLWLYQRSKELSNRRLTAGVAFIVGFIGFTFPIVLYVMTRTFILEPWLLVASLVIAGLGLEILAAGWRLRRAGSTTNIDKQVQAEAWTNWQPLALSSGMLAAILSYPSLSVALNIVFISIVMIEELLKETAPSPGLDWLYQILSGIFGFPLLLAAALSLVFGTISVGVVRDLVKNPKVFLWTWRRLEAIYNRVRVLGTQRKRFYAQILAIVLAGLLIIYVTSISTSPGSLAIMSAVITVIVLGWKSISHLSWSWLISAFALTSLGLVGLTLSGPNQLLLEAWWIRSAYAFIVGPAMGISYYGLTMYIPKPARPAARLTTLLGAILIIGLFSYVGQAEIVAEGGVSRYNNQRWETFTSDNSLLGSRLNYEFFSDSQGSLWFGGGTGIIVEQTAGGWRSYQMIDSPLPVGETSLDLESASQLGKRILFLEDKNGRIWVARDQAFGQLDPTYLETIGDSSETTDTPSPLRIPSRLLTGADLADSDPFFRRTSLSSGRCRNGLAQIWDTQGTYITTLTGHTDSVNSARYSPDGRWIVTGSDDGTARLWDAEGNLMTTFDIRGPKQAVTTASFSPDSTRIITVHDNGTARLWDINGDFIAAFEGYRDDIAWAKFSSDGTYLITGNRQSRGENRGGAPWLWDMAGNPIYASGLVGLDVDPAGKHVLEPGDNGVQLWRTDGTLMTRFEINGRLPEDSDDTITAADFSPDGRRIAAANSNGTVFIWDAAGPLINELESPHHEIDSLWFSPDGTRLMMVSSAGMVGLWDAEGHFIAHPDDVVLGDNSPLGYSPDGGRLVTLDHDNQVQIWDMDSNTLTPLSGFTWRVNAISVSPDGRHIITAECVVDPGIRDPGYVTHSINSPITGMALDAVGNLWLATANDGVIRLEGGRPLDDAYWEHFRVEHSNLASDNVEAILADSTGNVWVGTDMGLSRFDDTGWEIINLPGLETNTPVLTLLEDSLSRIWVGTTQGGYWGNSQDWISFNETPGWPDGSSVETLFEDRGGNLWVGTDNGVFRFDQQRWANPITDMHVTSFADGPPGVLWVGGEGGLVRYNLATNEPEFFEASNSGLATNRVRDLYTDQDGRLWVSTFSIDQIVSSPWWVMGTGLLFFGYLLVTTYQGYVRTPETRAQTLARNIIAEPDQLYPAIYALLTDTPDAPRVLSHVADYLTRANEQTGAESVRSLAALTANSDIETALAQTIASFEADSDRRWANPLFQLHRLLAKVVAVRRVPEIANLEMTVNPGQEAGDVSLYLRNQKVEALPPFLSPGSAEAWHTFEQVCQALHKYQSVDAASDRLSYLAEALSATEAAHTATQALGPPEGTIMTTTASRWREAVAQEIKTISGRAELRLELRTRQLRRSDQLTLALQLQNDGRAAAENVVVTLQPGEGFSLTGETQFEFQRLPSGRSLPIEFSISPADVENVRIVCQATWDDRTSAGSSLEFADVVHFYELAEEFQHIPNPYIVGHPVKSAEMFHGRQDIFRYIESNLSGSVQDRTLVLHGQRRTGKTSILYQLLQNRLGENVIPVLVDMQELALLVNSTGDFLAELAYQLARTVRKAGVDIEEPAPDAFDASPTRIFNRFLDRLEDDLNGRRVVIMFDEFELIEDKIVESKLDPNVLGYFRSLVQHRDGLTFIFTGTHRLEEMSHDYWSVLFNIALYRRVSFLTAADATRLIRQPVAGKLDIDELAVEKIIKLTRGQPYFIQLICWALVNHCNAQQRNYATINDVNDAVQEILTSGEAHFAYIWHRASHLDQLALVGLAHTLQPGQAWARPTEILEILAAGGDRQTGRATLVDSLDRLVRQEVLEAASEGALRYRFQIEVLRLWVQANKSVAAFVERGQ